MVPNIKMPVSVACESAISSAISNSLSATANTSAYNGGGNNNNSTTNINSQVVGSVKRGLLTKIEYEEAPPNFGNSMHDDLKAKYTFLDGSVQVPNKDLQNQPTTASASSCTTQSSTSNKDGPQIPTPKIVLFPRENVQIGWKNSGRKWQIGAGMINLGNTCYLNSTLQALFHVPAFANWLLSDVEEKHREQCESNTGSQGGCIICAMSKTLIASQKCQQPYKPLFVYSKLRIVCRRLIPGHQEDAHEFLRYLMEAMEKAYLSRFKAINVKFDHNTNETTPINQILGGYLKSSVRCLACGHVSVTFQHFEDLLLDIRKANSIEEALDVHFARERLEDMGYKCESCKKKVSATKQFSLERPPVALCIQLKRFSMMGGKLNKHVAIRQTLDLSMYSSKKQMEPLKYRLVAMVTHLGASQHCGHYTAIGLTDAGGYYQFDDSCVRPISLQNVLNTNAYIIFYELENDLMTSSTTTTTTTGTSIKYGNSTITSSKVSASAVSMSNDFNSKKCNDDMDEENYRHQKSIFGDSIINNNSSETKTNRFIGPLLPQQQTQSQQRPTSLSLSSNGNSNTNGLINTNLGSKLVNHNNKLLNGHSTNGTTTNRNNNNRSLLLSPSSTSSSSSVSSIIRVKPLTPKKDDSQQLNRLNGNNNSKKYHNEHKSESLSLNNNKCPISPTLPSMPNLDSLLVCNGNSNTNSPTKISTPNVHKQLKESTHSPIKCGAQNINKTNGSAAAASVSTNSIADKPKSLVPYTLDDGDDSDSNSPPNGSGNASLSSTPSTSPSPPIIKTKAGVWQVSKCSTNLFAPTKSTNNNNTLATVGNKLTKPFNGTNNNKLNCTNGTNGNNNLKRSSSDTTVHKLQKMSHMGYGGSVQTWNGQTSRLNNEVNNEKQEERKRSYDDLDDMDRGRMKKYKTHNNNNNYGRDNPNYNPYSEIQNQLNYRNNPWFNSGRSYNNYSSSSNRHNTHHNSSYNPFRGKRINRNGFHYQRGNRFNRRST